MTQYPECLTSVFLSGCVLDAERAIKLEEVYINECLKFGPILGYSAVEHIATTKFFMNMRFASVGLTPVFEDAYHAFPWMAEMMEIHKETNFFEKRVTEYQAGGALSFESAHHEKSHDPLWDNPL